MQNYEYYKLKKWLGVMLGLNKRLEPHCGIKDENGTVSTKLIMQMKYATAWQLNKKDKKWQHLQQN